MAILLVMVINRLRNQRFGLMPRLGAIFAPSQESFSFMLQMISVLVRIRAMKLKQAPLVLVVALAHAGGLAMLTSPRNVIEDTPPVLLSVAQMEISAAQDDGPARPAQSPRAEPKRVVPAPQQQAAKPAEAPKAAPQAVPPIAAESLVADSAPAAPAAMVMPKADEKAELPAATAGHGSESMAVAAAGGTQSGSGSATHGAAETQPSFQANYLNNPKPSYPSRSMALGEEGRVMLRVAVNEQGHPVRVEIVRSSGFPRLDEAARRTVERGWRFAPARRGDQAVAGVVQVPISFALRG
jgi:periplasmic protein TonB